MTVANSPMKHLYQKLRKVGYNPKFIESLLPDWWDDDIAETPAGLQQASAILANKFSIHIESLLLKDAEPVLRLPQGICFKRRNNVEGTELYTACAIARSLANVVTKGFSKRNAPEFYLDARKLRQQLLTNNKWIGIEILLNYCLDIGIPVIYLNHFPNKVKKMEGLAFMQGEYPVIVLTQNRPHGYMLFDLAHELGHITLGHVNAERSIVDKKIDLDSDDEDERAANRFALELLTGDPECKIVPTGRNLNANGLANAALRYGEDHQIDPLHIVLNYCYTKNHWPVAANAIKNIAAGEVTDQQKITIALQQFIDFDDLSEDNIDLLKAYSIG